MKECIKAYDSSDNNYEKAKQILIDNSRRLTVRNADRITAEGCIAAAIYGGNIAIVEADCETDFAANTKDLIDFTNSKAELAAREEWNEEGLSEIRAKLGENVILRRHDVLQFSDEPGMLDFYIHHNRKSGAIVTFRVLLRTLIPDIIANKEKYDIFTGSIAKHITAAKPKYISFEDLQTAEPDLVSSQREKFEMEASNKPEAIRSKIVDGMLSKWSAATVLLNQPFIFDEKKTVGAMIADFCKINNLQISIAGFVRYDIKD